MIVCCRLMIVWCRLMILWRRKLTSLVWRGSRNDMRLGRYWIVLRRLGLILAFFRRSSRCSGEFRKVCSLRLSDFWRVDHVPILANRCWRREPLRSWLRVDLGLDERGRCAEETGSAARYRND